MKNKGITLVALVITIIILLILAGITINSLTDSGLFGKVKEAKEVSIRAQVEEELKLIVNEWILERYSGTTKTINEFLNEKVQKEDLEGYNEENKEYEIYKKGYAITIDKDGNIIEEIHEVGKVINITGRIISEENGTTEVEEGTVEENAKLKITFNVKLENGEITGVTSTGTNTAILDASKSKVTYITDGTEKEITFTITGKIDGKDITKKYTVSVASKYVQLYTSDGSWDGKVNSPVLMTGMTGIYWDESGKEIKVTTKNKDNWYNYENQKWANAKTEDGSYWVWIPRYAYQITSGCYTNTAGEIKIKFLHGKENRDKDGRPIKITYPEVENGAMKDYVVHPAFTNGTANNFKNGEWDDDIKGIWVAKYEMSMETNRVATTTGSATVGDVTTSSTIKAVSKPGVTSWRYISIGKIYDNSYNYDRTKESHMMKNSEWGAVAYLSHSSYGRNKVEITINDNSSYYTGGSQGATAKTNMAQSSTGNETGIFDLSGGAGEYTAGYIANKNDNLKFGSTFVNNTTANPDGYLSLSTKYVTVYPYDSSNDTKEANYTKYKSLKSITYGFGDGILETSSSGNSPYTNGWFADRSIYVSDMGTFFTKGIFYSGKSDAGVFGNTNDSGETNRGESFRIVLVGK